MNLTKCIPAALIALCIVSACSDDDNGITLQDHDKNEFMNIMHNMNAQMDAMETTGDADHDFVMMMTMHHQGAIDMSNKLLEKGDDATIKSMAQMIITKQTAEKAELTTWLQNHTPESNAEDAPFDEEMMATMEKMKNWKDIQVLTGDADNDFAELMIVHHQQATDNAQSILHHGHHDDIKEMATMMIEDQNKEITDLAAWIKNKGAINK
ncbi:MAG: DUF305 domain-containing protein [Chryseolinea sp.]